MNWKDQTTKTTNNEEQYIHERIIKDLILRDERVTRSNYSQYVSFSLLQWAQHNHSYSILNHVFSCVKPFYCNNENKLDLTLKRSVG